MHDYNQVMGDVTDPQIFISSQPQTILIPHVVNNIGAFGAGVAKAIKMKWPNTEKEYHWWLNLWNKHKRSILGQSFASLVKHTDDVTIVVIHMFAQIGIRGRQNSQPLNYQHLQTCMERVPEIGTTLGQPFSIHCPKFGASLGGGNWNEIEKMIRTTWCMRDIPVSVYNYRRTNVRTYEE